MFRPIIVGWLAWVCAGSPAWAQVKLEHKYLPNTKAKTLESFNLKVKAQINGQDVELTGDSRMTTLSELLPPADNLNPVRVTLEAAAVGSGANGQNYMFDSALPDRTKSDNPEFEKEVETVK